MGVLDRVHSKAPVGVFSDDSRKQAWGLLSGALPGGMGAPPARSTADYLRAYAQMPWLRAVAMRIATAVASAEWQLFAVGKPQEKARRGGIVTRMQRAQGAHRRKLLKTAHDHDELKQIDEHPLLDVLTQANGFQTGLSMRKLTQVHLDLVGDAFWLKERDGQGTPVGVWPIPPHWILATPTPQFRFFRVSFRAWRGLIPDTEFLWFSDDDPMNPYARGTGLAQSLGDELETDEYAARYTKAFFYNSARPDMLIYPKGGSLQGGNVKKLEEDWLANAQGFFKAFKPYFLSREVEVKTFDNSNLRSMQFTQLREFERNTILQVFGMPPEILGVLEHSNRATISTADYLMSRYVVEPRLEFLRSVLQERFVPEYDDRIIIDFVSPVAADDDHSLAVATAAPWALTIDEWRNMAGKDPMENEADGQQHMVQNTLTPKLLTIAEKEEAAQAAQDALDALAQQPQNGPGKPGKPNGNRPADAQNETDGNPNIDNPKRLRRAMASMQDASIAEAIAAAAASGDVVLAEALHKATSLDIDRLPVASATAARQEPGLARALVHVWLEHQDRVKLSDIAAALDGVVGDVVDALDLPQLNDAQSGVLESQLSVGFVRGAEVAAAGLRRNGMAVRAGLTGRRAMQVSGKQSLVLDMNAVNPLAVEWAERHAGELVVASAQVRETIRQLVVRSIAEGITPQELARMVRETIGLTAQQTIAVLNFGARLVELGVPLLQRENRVARYSRAQLQSRALTIARTELISALSAGQQALWDVAVAQGVLHDRDFQKTWIVTDDELLEAECESLADEQVDIGQAFSNGDMHPPAHPNCRCAIGLVPRA